MSRSDYSDDIDHWDLIRYRGQVASAIRGKRGQAFLRELIEALDALPEPKLIAGDFGYGVSVCALGAVAVKRGVDVITIDENDYWRIADLLGIARSLVREIEDLNDETYIYEDDPEDRWRRMRAWAVSNLKEGKE